ncbi:MAG TPA: glycosyltransferase family 2 protein [Sphingomicrobium sp.]|jgi:biofilm PGA synthesis N-glycosyltransferase PgaC|nr:glycosyltransferase family 2 protein [Sphingomicrobium sp.]
MASLADAPLRGRPRIYIPVSVKFGIAVFVALSWVMFSILASRPWMEALSDQTHWLFALFAITFIAYVPGFMNTFLTVSLLLDKRPRRKQPEVYPGVTVLIAAYQEEAAIAGTLESIAKDAYPGPLEVLVLNDGSTDRTVDNARRAIERLEFPAGADVRVLDFEVNRGKSAVLNSGLEQASHDLIVTIDGDSRLHPGALGRLVERYLSDPAHTQAVAGAILVGNSRENIITGAQEWDYFHGIAAVKRMQSLYQGTLVAQGAFSLYRRSALREVGGWQDVVGEDIVLSWAMLDKGYRIGYAEDAIAWTNAPTSFRQFARQRQRWSRGLIEALNQHESLLFKRRLTQMFIWWNLLFLPLDATYTFVFIPGVIAAIFFQLYWVAGLMTLAVIPIAILWNTIIFRAQAKMFREQGLKVRHNPRGLIFYLVCYALMMQPMCVWGYAVESLGLKKKWGTK